MAELPYMPVVVNDEIAEASDLTNEELGAFWRLKLAMWKAGGYLVDDAKKLARIARAGKRWGQIAPAVMAKLTFHGGKVSCPELLATLLITRERRRKAALSAGTRWAKSEGGLSPSNPLKEQQPAHANASPEHMLGASKHNQNKHDQDSFLGESAPAARKGSAAEARSDADFAQTLYKTGTELLTERCDLTTLQAKSQLSRWMAKVHPMDLARFMADAEQHNLKGQHFLRVVDSGVEATYEVETKGPRLPLDRPHLAAKKG